MSTTTLSPSANRSLYVVCLIVGVVALTLGVIASDSIGSDFSRLFTGRPTDKAIWLLIGGAITTVGGLIGLARGSR
jgi:hypothetical protein